MSGPHCFGIVLGVLIFSGLAQAANFQGTWKLETRAMQAMWELNTLKEERVELLISKILKTIDAEDIGVQHAEFTRAMPWMRESQFDRAIPTNKSAWDGGRWLEYREPDVLILDGKIAESKKKLSGIESQLDASYQDYFFSDMKANPFANRPQNSGDRLTKIVPLTDDDHAKMALLYMTTQLRRGVGEPLHTELWEHTQDADCAGDVISDQLFLKMGISIIGQDYRHALDYDAKIAAQSMCISAYQLAVVDYHLFDAIDKTLLFVPDADTRQTVVDSLLNPLLIIYDVAKPEYSMMFELIRKYRDLISTAYSQDSMLRKFGIYLMNWSTGKVKEIKFQPHTGEALTAFTGEAIETPYEPGVTTIYGYDIAEFQKENCFKDPAAPPKPGTVSWDKFVERIGDPLHLGRGLSPFNMAIALGRVDRMGLCDVVTEPPPEDGPGLSCSFSKAGQLSVMVKCMPQGPAPFKTPVNPFVSGEVTGEGGDKMSNNPLQFAFKSTTSCGSSPYANVSPGSVNPPPSSLLPEPKDKPSPAPEEDDEVKKEDEKGEDSTQPSPAPSPSPPTTPPTSGDSKPTNDGNKGSGPSEKEAKAIINKAINDFINGTGSQSKAASADSAADKVKKAAANTSGGSKKGGDVAKGVANKALKNAMIINGIIKKVDKNGNAFFHDVHKKIFHREKCNVGAEGCKLGETKANAMSVAREDGTYQIYIDLNCAEGCNNRPLIHTLQHEWVHVHLWERGLDDNHHQLMEDAKVRRCSETDDSCSSSCSAQEVLIGQHFKCDQFWPQIEKPTEKFCEGPVADCVNPDQSDKQLGGNEYAPNTQNVPDFCLTVSGGDGPVPPECVGSNPGGSSCQFGDALPVNIVKMIPGFGYTDPPPWLDQTYINKRSQATTPKNQIVNEQQVYKSEK